MFSSPSTVAIAGNGGQSAEVMIQQLALLDVLEANTENDLALKARTFIEKVLGVMRAVLVYTLEHPKKTRVVLAIGVMGVIGLSFASAAHGQALDTIDQQFTNATNGWMGNSVRLAQNLFALLAFIMIVYNLVANYIAFSSERAMALTIVRSMMSFGTPYIILFFAVPTFLDNLLQNAGVIATSVTGRDFTGTTVDQIWLLGVKIGFGLLQAAWGVIMQSHFQFNPLGGAIGGGPNVSTQLAFDAQQMLADVLFLIFGFVLMIMIIASFVFIAVEFMLAKIQAIFAIPLGAWALGFSGSPATGGFASGAWSAIVQTMVRYVAILAAVELSVNIANSWLVGINQVAQHGTKLSPDGAVDFGFLRMMISYGVTSVALWMITLRLPTMASAILSGAPVFGAASTLGGAAFAAGSVMSAGAAAPVKALHVGATASGIIQGARQPGASGGSPSLGERWNNGTNAGLRASQRSQAVRRMWK